MGGFPNFFGIQRFGIIRPITHTVGEYIIKDDWEKAVMTYIANPIKGEDEEIFLLRENLEKTLDYSQALKTFPNSLNFEKAILNKLVVNSEDFIGALKELPKNLLTMFVYAYQSYLFNKIVSERIKRKIPLNEARVGDIIIPIRKGVFEDRYIFTNDQNIGKVNNHISKGKAAVSGILFGYDSIFSKGEMGEIEQKVIEKEKIDPRDFIIPDIPYLSSAGIRRPIFAFIKNLEMKLQKDELKPKMKLLFVKFKLNKGVYATSILREIMKTQNLKNY
jgi:tRNA pseudouridine13 synthase